MLKLNAAEKAFKEISGLIMGLIQCKSQFIDMYAMVWLEWEGRA